MVLEIPVTTESIVSVGGEISEKQKLVAESEGFVLSGGPIEIDHSRGGCVLAWGKSDGLDVTRLDDRVCDRMSVVKFPLHKDSSASNIRSVVVVIVNGPPGVVKRVVVVEIKISLLEQNNTMGGQGKQ